MKIGIHKLGFDNYASLVSAAAQDKNGMRTELDIIMDILIEAGYDVRYVNSDTFEKYDIIFLFNGYQNSTSNIYKFRGKTKELNFILTDSRFHDIAMYNQRHIDNIFVQGPSKMFGIPTFNSYLQKLPIYFSQRPVLPFEERTNGHVFGGSVRDRKEKILEYVIRPDAHYYLKFEDLDIDTRVSVETYQDIISTSKFGIVLINKVDTIIGNITWRYYEYIANGVLTFIDRESDPGNLILPSNMNFMRVSNYIELTRKKELLLKHPALAESYLRKQSEMITEDDKSGKTWVNSLIEKREENVRKI